jgi:hypothetical protein
MPRDGSWTPGAPSSAEATATAPAGGASASVRDLTAWIRLQLADGAFQGQQIVASAPLAETHTPHILATLADPVTGTATFYGLGWEMEFGEGGRLLLRHGGDLSFGFRTGVYLRPDAGLGVVVLTNSWPNPLRDAIPRTFLDTVETGGPTRDWVQEIADKTTTFLATTMVAPFPQGPPPADAVPPLPLATYAGVYANELYGNVTIEAADGSLTLGFGAHPADTPLRPWDRDTFSYPLAGFEAANFDQFGVVFAVGPERQAIALTVPSLGDDATATFARDDP